MFGRPLRTPLGSPKDIEVNYNKRLKKFVLKDAFHIWNKKDHAKFLPESQPGQLVRIKAPTDGGREGVVKRKD